MSSLIQCENLSKFYAGKRALDAVSFECQAGEPIALVGPNGAGKTTLFSILCAYLSPSSGSVQVLGHEPGSSALLGEVAALPQDAQFDPAFSISRQLAFYAELQGFNRKQAKEEALRVLGLMDLSDSASAYPAALSHGMRKRAAIAQALIGNPKLVLLDEPTAGLDPANAKNIRQQIAAISGDTTFVISSHNLQELERLCGTVLYLENGQLQQTTPEIDKEVESYITLHMVNVDRERFIADISTMDSVLSVGSDQKNEFVVRYDAEKAPDLDQQLLQRLAGQSWDYRRLIKGKTLEERLFS